MRQPKYRGDTGSVKTNDIPYLGCLGKKIKQLSGTPALPQNKFSCYSAPNTNPDSFTSWHMETRAWVSLGWYHSGRCRAGELATAEPVSSRALRCCGYPTFTRNLGLSKPVGDQRMLKKFQSQSFIKSQDVLSTCCICHSHDFCHGI